MEMNSVMATEIVAAEVEHIVLPQSGTSTWGN